MGADVGYSIHKSGSWDRLGAGRLPALTPLSNLACLGKAIRVSGSLSLTCLGEELEQG